MYTIFAILIIITSILLVLVVLVQNPKGGGLSSSFGGGGGNQIMGAKKTTDFLEKATWTLAIAMFALILLSNFSIERNGSSDIKLDNTLEDIRSTPKTTESSMPATNDSLNN